MHLIYIDESGNTGSKKDSDQPLHLIGAVIVHESKVRSIEDAIDTIVGTHMPDAWMVDGFELHGADLFGGKGAFKTVAPATRIAVIQDVIAALRQNEVVIGWAAVDKMKLYTDKHPHHLAFVLLAERLELYLRRIDALGLIVADENKEIEQRLIDDFEVYKAGTTSFGWRPIRIKQMIDSVHFVQSKNNRLIQCADLVAYFVLRAERASKRLLTAFQAIPEPKGTWPAYREGHATPSEAAVLKIASGIAELTEFQKVFPE